MVWSGRGVPQVEQFAVKEIHVKEETTAVSADQESDFILFKQTKHSTL